MNHSIAPACAFALTLLLPTTAAAQNQYNEVIRFGARDLVQSAKNPLTGYALEVPGAQEPAYMATATTGVAKGTLTWMWYPSQLNSRLQKRTVTGHMVGVRASSATPLSDYSKTQTGQSGPGVPIYLPKFSVWPAKARAPKTPPDPFGPGFDPDFGKSPLLTYNTVHRPLVQKQQAGQALLWTVTYNTAVKIDSKEMVLAFEWEGGEHFQKPRSQCLPTGWSESMFQPSHWGWASPGPARKITRFDSKKILPGTSLDIYSSPMGGYFANQATIAFHCDWGEARNPALAGLVYASYNVGSGLADVAGTKGALGWDVFTSATNRGLRSMPLLNGRSAPVAVPTAFLGRVFEVNLSDLALPLLWGNSLADGVISSTGTWLPTSRIPVPALGSLALGLWVGMEYALVDIGTGAVADTTQAFWFYVAK